jgi:hypothetical protein
VAKPSSIVAKQHELVTYTNYAVPEYAALDSELTKSGSGVTLEIA